MKPEDLLLADVLDFRPDQGIIRLKEQRVVILSAAAMGLLRKELIETFGMEVTRRLLLRFGYADGYHDAVNLRDRSSWTDAVEGLRAGATLHALEGIVRAVPLRLEFDAATGRFDSEVECHDSYVAEQHLHHFGKSSAPVCWSLAGYSTGYASGCLRQEVYFTETACLSQGQAHCSLVGKDAARWGEALESLRRDYRGTDLGQEVERLRELVHRQLRDLTRRERMLARRERELDVLRERITRAAASRQFVAKSVPMQEVLEMAARVAPLETTVLVCGESGTGKEFIVRMIHDQSPRADQPFVSVNCAALPETLLESELFGHVRGAFTGAVRDKTGLFEVASRGTLFLDEIGEMAPTIQAKLLRALQEGEIRRVGSERSTRVNPRVIAATNRDLRAAVSAGAFREDLYFRLGAFVITVPPLRDRREAIPVLVHQFLRAAARQTKKDVRAVSAEAMSLLMDYRWPGNVRELENAIQRAVILAPGRSVTVRELPPEVRSRTVDKPADDGLDLDEHERRLILRALDRFRGDRKLAAKALNISTVTLWRRMKRYRLDDMGRPGSKVSK
ncbi:MAG TPA: sigma 54-interacting transcriptional regulator [Candidatus Polarisedimenticolia bacterium]|nr:sigma 54-interacting transcriptional regulator [Candidatus Polarisedimenticolia bacterium]